MDNFYNSYKFGKTLVYNGALRVGGKNSRKYLVARTLKVGDSIEECANGIIW